MSQSRRRVPDEAAFRKLFEAEDAVGLAVLDTEGRIRFANAALGRLCGDGPGPQHGRAAACLFAADTAEGVAEAIRAALAGPPAPPVVLARLADPSLPEDSQVEVTCRPLRGEPGALLRVADVTARRRMQAQMEEGARLQSVGRLAGGVAHDFNNLLAAISGAAESALARHPDAATVEDLRQILDSAARGARLVKQLLAFASRQALAPRVVPLSGVVEAMLPLLRRLLGGRHVPEYAPPPAPGPLVRVDASQLDQVLLNLVVNARDAMPAGGRIRIAVETRHLDDDLVAPGAVVPAGDWVVLSVADAGRGITPTDLPRIFEPFFTTRRDTGGTGLGLPTVLGILRQSGGHVTVATRLGEGTTFHLWFPEVGATAEAAPAPPSVAARSSGPRRVLLVEDEAPLRRLAAHALKAAGHEVQEAEDAETALEAVEGGFAPDVLVTDITMPGEMDGFTLAEMLRERLPAMSVVLASGYAERAVGEGVAERGFAFLEKPFRMAALLGAVAGSSS
ncbi:response regulator [Roseomonas sp. HJA6]|uniref:histidine kinase n=1 Tax=Roseomonas alba TaxID=2846776 RepID=A0ABS7A6B8_9PROT|nr:response regulator [Neoroseomonas alba]